MGSKWFVTFGWWSTTSQRINNKIIDEHPIKWLLKMIEKYPDESYTLLFWEEMKFSLSDDDTSLF